MPELTLVREKGVNSKMFCAVRVCPGCGRVPLLGKWLAQPIPKEWYGIPTLCPDCEKKGMVLASLVERIQGKDEPIMAKEEEDKTEFQSFLEILVGKLTDIYNEMYEGGEKSDDAEEESDDAEEEPEEEESDGDAEDVDADGDKPEVTRIFPTMDEIDSMKPSDLGDLAEEFNVNGNKFSVGFSKLEKTSAKRGVLKRLVALAEGDEEDIDKAAEKTAFKLLGAKDLKTAQKIVKKVYAAQVEEETDDDEETEETKETDDKE